MLIEDLKLFINLFQDNGDSILNDLNDILLCFKKSKKSVPEIIRQMKDSVDIKVNIHFTKIIILYYTYL